MVPCLLEVRHNVTENKCKNFLTKMQAVYFSDYRLIKGFVDACQKDVQKYKCGRIEQKDEEVCEENNDVILKFHFVFCTFSINNLGKFHILS